MASKSNGAILYRGPSMLDGAPIVVIAVGLNTKSKNSKTGGMLQTYILRDDIGPTAAIRQGKDASICGDCIHRGDGTGKGRTCYVNVGQGVLVVYKAYKRGVYDDLTRLFTGDRLHYIRTIGRGRLVRLGTYGDPAAVPCVIWDALTTESVGYTGYTHQWRDTRFANLTILKRLCMASADTPQDAQLAQENGWRTFRVAMPSHTPRMANEAICPASAEAGRKLTCATCVACGGLGRGDTPRRGSIVIQAHGGTAVMANVRKRDQSAALAA